MVTLVVQAAVSYSGDKEEKLSVTRGSQESVLPASAEPNNALEISLCLAVMGQQWSGQFAFRKYDSSDTGKIVLI